MDMIAMESRNTGLKDSGMPERLALSSTIHPPIMMTMSKNSAKTHKCCCCDGARHCIGSQCDMGVHLSFFLQTVQFSPVFVLACQARTIHYRPLNKELTPPFRPPLFS